MIDKQKNIKKCSKCGKEKTATKEFFYFQYGRPHGKCIDCQKTPEERGRRNEYAKGIRLMALAFYGGEIPECNCCGEKEIKFLGIDHIEGGGVKHRKELQEAGTTIYLWLRKNNYPEGFQVLCHNCNLAKGYYGECPHKLIKT